MIFPTLFSLCGICYFHWTTAIQVQRGPSILEINDGCLENVTSIGDTDDIEITDLNLSEIALGAFDAVTHIKRLDLSCNNITNLPPKVFSKLSNLERLSLADNKLNSREFNRIFDGLTKMRRLTLSGNDLSFLNSNSFIGLPSSAVIVIRRSNFREFNLYGYKIWKEELPELVSGVPPNIKIQLCDNNGVVESLSELEKGEGSTPNCSRIRVHQQENTIDLSRRGLRNFKGNWYQLVVSDIRFIDLSENELGDITPEILNDLPMSVTIDFYDSDISIIRKNIMMNKHCMSLYFGGISLQAIEDDAFAKLCLHELVIEDSSLKDLNFIRTLPIMIEYLTISNNEISEIPSHLFENLEKLRMIDLSLNELKRIEANVFMGSAFTALGRKINLYLDHNVIDFIAEGSFFDVNLHHLTLSYNKIENKSIKKGAFLLSNIKLIDLTNNLMTSFDEESFIGIANECRIKLHGNPIINITNVNYRKKNLV